MAMPSSIRPTMRDGTTAPSATQAAHASLIDTLIGRLAKGGEIALAGFYESPLSFAFPPAFMREARLRIAAELTLKTWKP